MSFRRYPLYGPVPKHEYFCGSVGSGKTSFLQLLIESYLKSDDTSVVFRDWKDDPHFQRIRNLVREQASDAPTKEGDNDGSR